MSKPTTYARIPVTEGELQALRNLVSQAQRTLRSEAEAATGAQAKEFYQGRVEFYEPLLKKLEQPFLNDRSQDAEPEPKEDDE